MKTIFDFAGHNFLVTGVSSGIGLATARALLAAGANVLGIARHADKVTDMLADFGERFTAANADVTSEADVTAAIKTFVASCGPLSGFVHSAGIANLLPIKAWHKVKIAELLEVNLVSGMMLLKLVSRHDYSLDGSSYVFISSVSAHRGQMALGVYAASKGALEAMVKTAALELARRHQRVNSACFGWLPTKMSLDIDSRIEQGAVPLGSGEVDDAASLALFLLSEKSRWITGTNIVMDGGYLAS